MKRMLYYIFRSKFIQFIFVILCVINSEQSLHCQENHYQLTCRLDSTDGYFALLVKKMPNQKTYQTYYSFIPKDSITSIERFNKLVSKSDTMDKLTNLDDQDFNYLQNLYQYPVLYSHKRILEIIWSNQCNDSFRTGLVTMVTNNMDNIPNLLSFWLDKRNIKIRKPTYFLKKVRIKYLILSYDTFNNYINEQVDNVLAATKPKMKSLYFGYMYPIVIMPIQSKKVIDTYDIIVPIQVLR